MPPKSKKKIGAEEKEDPLLLRMDDFERRGINIHDEKIRNLTSFEALSLVAEVASQKLLEEEKEFKRKKKDPNPNWVSNQERLMMTERSLKKHSIIDHEHVCDPKKQKPLKNRIILDLNQNPQELDVVECEKPIMIKINKQKRSSLAANEMPEKMRKMIEMASGNNIKLATQISFFHTDNGMSIPMTQIRSGFLTQKEKELLDQGDCMTLVLMEPSRATSLMGLKKWRIINEAPEGDHDHEKKNKNKYYSYGLTTDWKKIRMANDLKEGDEVQLWSFRIKEQLCLALVRVFQAGESSSAGTGSKSKSQRA